MAKQKVTVPDIGGAEGAEVIELLVAVGDEVAEEQGLIVLESDKASMEIPSNATGTVVEMLVVEGQELNEGDPVAVIDTAGAGEDESPAEVHEGKQEAPEQTVKPTEAPAAVPEATTGAGTAAVPVPDIGTDEAVELIEVCVQVGDRVAEGDSLVVLESDKASMEVPAPFAGEVSAIRVAEGDSVKQGDLLLDMTLDAPAVASASEPPVPSATIDTPAQAPKAAATESPPAVEPAAAASSGHGEIYAGPAVRKLAREFGIPLSNVGGSGPRGRILKEDLHKFVQAKLSQPATTGATTGIPEIPEVDFAAFGKVEVTQRSKLDKLTASNMQRSWLNVPHVTQFDDADITELEAFRASLKGEAEQRGVKLTPMPFLLKACAVALRDNPKFCSSLADGGESLVYKQYIHIGMAVDTPAGLVVPVIRDVDTKSIWELAEEVLEMAGRARDRKLKPADMQGGCFTISSLGNIGGSGFTPIVNAPEVGILGVSRAEMKPVWDGQAFVPRKMLPLALSYDHRVINGGDGGRFMTRLVALLADIRQLLM